MNNLAEVAMAEYRKGVSAEKQLTEATKRAEVLAALFKKEKERAGKHAQTLEVLQKEMSSYKKENVELHAKLSEALAAKDNIANKYAQLNSQQNCVHMEVGTLRGMLETLSKKRDTLNEELVVVKRKLEESERHKCQKESDFKTTIQELHAQISTLKEQVKQKSQLEEQECKRNAKLTEELTTLRKTETATKGINNDLESKLRQLDSRIELLQKELRATRSARETIVTKYATLQTDLSNVRHALKVAIEENSQLQRYKRFADEVKREFVPGKISDLFVTAVPRKS